MKKEEILPFIDNLPIRVDVDVRLGLSTRSVCKINDNRFEITDTCDGWQIATVNKQTLINVLSGEKSLLELNWK